MKIKTIFLSLIFLLTPAAFVSAQTITSFTLVDATSNADIRTLTDGDIINLSINPEINIRANTAQEVDNITFTLTGAEIYIKKDNRAPYALFGDGNGNYHTWNPTVGNYSLTADPNVGTPSSISFSVASFASENPNNPPVANDQTVSTPEGQPVGITLSATDADGDALSYSVSVGPSSGSLSGTAPNLTYTPNTGFSGDDSFTFSVLDGQGGSDVGVVSIAVGSSPSPSSGVTGFTLVDAVSDTDIRTLANGGTIDPLVNSAINIRANTTADVGKVFFTLTGPEDHTQKDNKAPFALFGDGNGNYHEWNPPEGNYVLSAAPDTGNPLFISFTVESLGIPDETNNPPLADDQSVSTLQDQSVDITLSATDVDGDILAYAIETGTTNGSLGGAAPNLTYTPNTGFSGNDSFTFSVSDGNGGSDIGLVSITVISNETTSDIVNGSFEDPVVTDNGGSHQYFTGSEVPGWFITGDVDIVRDAFEAADGFQALDLNGNDAGSISQVLNGLEPGAVYQLSVQYARHPSGQDDIRSADVVVNEQVIGTLSTSQKVPAYQTATFNFTPASDGSADIEFVSTSPNTSVGVVLDNVQVNGGSTGVTSFTLVDAAADTDIMELNDGMTIDVATYPDINVRANATSKVDSVTFSLSGPEIHAQVEGIEPYALFGDSTGDYNIWNPTVGSYTLVATPDVGNDLTISFSVVDSGGSTGGGTEPPLAQCEDAIDNDGDGKIDYPDDPGCTSLSDDDETDSVGDPIDDYGLVGFKSWTEVDGVTYGAKPDAQGPIGGYKGYAHIVTSGDVTATTFAGIQAALDAAQPGDTIYVPHTASIDLTSRILQVPGGVTLASNRGEVLPDGSISPGALFFSNREDPRVSGEPKSSNASYIIEVNGDNTRITGFRIKGKDEHAAPELEPDDVGRTIGVELKSGDNFEFDNNEVYNFINAGVRLRDRNSKGHHTHHNYFHNIWGRGRGYGVAMDQTGGVHEYNLFNAMRHATAHTGRNPVSNPGNTGDGIYTARHNVVLDKIVTSQWDMHASPEDPGTLGSNNGGRAGVLKLINNYQIAVKHHTLDSTRSFVQLRGTPYTAGSEFTRNWIHHPTSWPISQIFVLIEEVYSGGEVEYNANLWDGPNKVVRTGRSD